MNAFKASLTILLKAFLAFTAIVVLYFLVAFALSAITVERSTPLAKSELTKTIYIHTNGVHLDIAMSKQDASSTLLTDLQFIEPSDYLSFGWGDEDFYLNTPTWGDLSAKTAVTALFMKSPTLMHVTYYSEPTAEWVPVIISEAELAKLNIYLEQSFTLINGKKKIIPNQSYGDTDQFYRANGSYTLFNTCNTWANDGFKQSGLTASYWTPFDFGLLKKYDK